MRSSAPSSAVVLVHGFLGWGSRLRQSVYPDYFYRIEPFLRACGLRVLAPSLAPAGHPAARAQQLLSALHAWPERRAGERVTVIAHSQGGLDARWAISQLGADGLVEQLITLGTPHRGSALCDELLRPASRYLPPATRRLLARVHMPTEAATYLSKSYVEGEFNPSCPDASDVVYRSHAGARSRARECWWPLVPARQLLQRWEGPNDCLVSVESARWGEFLGVEEMDHVDMINFPLKLGPWKADPWPLWTQLAQRSGGRVRSAGDG